MLDERSLRTVLWASLLLAGLSAWNGGVAAQTELTLEEERRARRLSDQLMSPFCPGRTLNECPSPSAGEWREDVRQWVGEGVAPDEIRERLEARAPGVDITWDPGGGSDVSPLLFVLLGALGVTALLLFPRHLASRRERREAARAEPPPPPRDRAADARLEEELAELDR